MHSHTSTRRSFIGALSAAAVVAQSRFASVGRASPLERSTAAIVGLGTRGFHLLNAFLQNPDVQVIAVCDVHDAHYRDRPWGTGPKMGGEPARDLVDRQYSRATKSGEYRGCELYRDYRRLLGRDDLDVVVVATPDHWHARIAIDAVRRGYDVYCEKPVTHFFAEGQALIREVAKHRAVFQVGSQQRSDALFRKAVELVRNGVLGRISQIEVGLPPGYAEAMDDTTSRQPPAGLDYDLWCGPAPKLPYMRARHHRWWRSTRAFGGGVLMDWIGHHNDIAHWSLDQENAGPRRVEAIGWTKSGCSLYDTPQEYEIRCDYGDGLTSRISTKVKQGTKWIGENGWLWVDRGRLEASQAQWLEPSFVAGPWKAYHSDDHVANFVDCVRSRGECITSAEIGHRSITPGHLGYVSHAVGRALKWDPQRETVLDDDQAQQLLLNAPYREPWSLS